MIGKQVEPFLSKCTRGRFMTAEITSWTGSIVSVRRSDLADLLAAKKAERTGMHVLLGEDEYSVGDTRCYVTEADRAAPQLRTHVKEEPFWNQAVVVTSMEKNLIESHVRYLESRLLELSKEPDVWFDDPSWSGGRNV